MKKATYGTINRKGCDFMKYEKGTHLHGFTVETGEHIKEINADAYLLSHDATKAKLMYIDTEDDNKVFSVSFRTPPQDSTGVAHILEHSVLCGSEKFPLKEPFVDLVKGSLNTFLNAMTYPDKTMYPVASRNAQDFHNLMDVYLDAVFFPNIRTEKKILQQEGWHYELTDVDGAVIYNGVVFNEMKGALSSPDDIVQEKAMEILFPDTTYGNESGGDPDFIPDLTYEKFMDFYERHYHPSNSYFFLYGDLDIEETLAFIDSQYLSRFTYRKVATEIGTQRPLPQRVLAQFPFGVAQEDSLVGKTLHSIDIVLPDEVSTVETLGMEILNYALLTVPGAILRERIVEAGLAKDVGGNYSESIKQPIWHIEAVGSEPEYQEEILKVFDETIAELAEKGLAKDLLESSLNRMEFALREGDFQGRPKGLLYNIKAMSYWLYDRDPFQALRYEEDLKTLREGLDKGYFEALLRRFVMDNTHQAAVSMIPTKGWEEKKERETAEKLAAYKAGLTTQEVERLCKETKELKEWQSREDTEEQRKTIPLLKRIDLPREIELDNMQKGSIDQIELYHYESGTNGILYTNFYFPLDHIAPDEYPYVVLLIDVLANMDTQKHTYGQLAQEINMHTGGIQIDLATYPHCLDDSRYRPFVVVRGKALTTKADNLAALIGEIINETVWLDTKRLSDLIHERKTDWDMQMFRRGHALMMNRVLSYVSAAEAFIDASELSYYEFLNQVVHEDIEAVAEKLAKAAKKVFTQQGLIAQSVGTVAEQDAFIRALPLVTEGLQEKSPATSVQTWNKNQGNEAFLSVGKVQYVAQGGNFRHHGFTYTGAMQVLETVLRYEYLWQHIRVLGGAYGAFSKIATNGNMAFCSYRDPNLQETLAVYAKMGEAISQFNVSDRVMTQYVIGSMASTQMQFTPRMKANRAMSRLLTETTPDFRQQVRNQIIDCTQADIRALGEVIDSVIKDKQIAVMGGEAKINENKSLFRGIKSFGR